MSAAVELTNVTIERAAEDDRGDLLAYRLFAVGPSGRDFWTTFMATRTLAEDPVAFEATARATLRSTYLHLSGQSESG